MLTYLSIENFALIERLELEFKTGLTLLTGETGSGKSILVDALGQLLGNRASVELVRSGADRARLTGIFRPPAQSPVARLLAEAGIEFDGQELIVRREIAHSGANRIFVNGVLSTQGYLSDLGSSLADIHGQHDQQSLLQARTHLDFLDRFAGIGGDAEEMAATFRKLQTTRSRLLQLDSREREREQRMETLRYQLADIDRLQLKPGLLEEFEAERNLLGSAEKRLQNANSAYQILYEAEPSLLGELSRVLAAVEELSQLDPRLAGAEERIRETRFQLQEIAYELRDYGDAIEFDPARLDAVESRLAEISLARKKYGDSVERILEHRQELERELLDLEDSASGRARLEAEAAELEGNYRRQAEKVAAIRHLKAQELEQAVESELAQLAMNASRFEVSFVPLESPAEQGLEEIEFLFSANPGEPPKPLTRVASGGELSRLILGLKSILLLERYPKTLVFDEVDAGIGGRVATVLGRKLSALARQNQVFCVTHLAQVAARADHHFVIDKVPRDGRTVVTVRPVQDGERIQELARMLTGDQVTPTTLQQARELITG